MRIVGGTLSGRRLEAPTGQATRPTSDRVREALFNILSHHDFGLGRDHIVDTHVLDICCGTGALAFEALSRGASDAVLMDSEPKTLEIAARNASALGLTQRVQMLRVDATRPSAANLAAQLVFLDPPYRRELPQKILPALQQAGWLAHDALLVIETAADETLDLSGWDMRLSRRYGDTALGFFVAKPRC